MGLYVVLGIRHTRHSSTVAYYALFVALSGWHHNLGRPTVAQDGHQKALLEEALRNATGVQATLTTYGDTWEASHVDFEITLSIKNGMLIVRVLDTRGNRDTWNNIVEELCDFADECSFSVYAYNVEENAESLWQNQGFEEVEARVWRRIE